MTRICLLAISGLLALTMGIPRASHAAGLTFDWVLKLRSHIDAYWHRPSGSPTRPRSLRAFWSNSNPGGAVKNASLVEVTPHPKAKAFVESVVVAIKRCQPYTFLPAEEYTGGWDKLDMTFSGNPSATAELKSGPLIDAREISRKLDQLRRERGKTDDTH